MFVFDILQISSRYCTSRYVVGALHAIAPPPPPVATGLGQSHVPAVLLVRKEPPASVEQIAGGGARRWSGSCGEEERDCFCQQSNGNSQLYRPN